MNHIITISREFGSGLNKEYIAHLSERDIRAFYPSTIDPRLVSPPQIVQQSIKTAITQHEIIRQLAEQGACVIVGRCADIVCQDMEPLKKAT